MAFEDTLIGREAIELDGTAHWRGEKALQYPEDRRNAQAQELLLKLAGQLPTLVGTPREVAFEALHDFVFSGDDTDNPLEVSRLWSEYRSRIGFNNFPETAEEYLDDLMDLAREAS